jgi:eukaryotic-like serine/threonine-protein kinase
MPDSRRLVFSAGPPGKGNLFWQIADGSRPPEQLTRSANGQFASAIAPDNQVIFREEIGVNRDLMIVRLGPPPQPRSLLKTSFSELNGEVSPDGKWLAYESNDSGQFEIYVRPFPNVDAARSLVSTIGGSKPVWARSGKELFYVASDGALMSVAVVPGNSWNARKPTKVLETPYYYLSAGGGNRPFDIFADGQRFLMIKEGAAADPRNRTAGMVLVFNWLEELKQRVPTK